MVGFNHTKVLITMSDDLRNSKHMTAEAITPTHRLQYPVYGSPKIDGIRACCHDGKLISRSLKTLPNNSLQNLDIWKYIEGMDGELTYGPPNAKDVYNQTSSAVMSHSRDIIDNTVLHVFDYKTKVSLPYTTRYNMLLSAFDNDPVLLDNANVKIVEQTLLENDYDLDEYEEIQLNAGYEGIMVRSLDGIYKFGKSTLKQGYLVKVKRFVDSEARILEFNEKQHNGNEAFVSEDGSQKRSSHQENKIGLETLGALVVQDVTTNVVFKVGTGFNDEIAAKVWQNRPAYLGKIITYKHFPIGAKDKPRMPVFKGFRDPIDME